MPKSNTSVSAKKFSEMWAGKGDEKQDTQKFWIGFIRMVLGIENAEDYIEFEKPVKYSGHTTFIDAYIKSTNILIEQKSIGTDLDKPELRHGQKLTPFQQAEQYSQKLVHSQKARYIIVSNFQTFRIHDLDKQGYESEYDEINLCDLEKEYYRFTFLIDRTKHMLQKEMEISLCAGEIVGEIYEAFLKQYDNPKSDLTLQSLNKLCVRLVFCLYAEDAGIFGNRMMFHDYLQHYSVEDMRDALIKLFDVLNQDIPDRDKYLKDSLKAFPYVNGGLFGGKPIEIPQFTDEIADLILRKASENFDWSGISPTIFGAVFESTLNPETRRSGGMHYTSIENIHKVIDPLFLDDLKAELETILTSYTYAGNRRKALEAYRDKLASLCFLDPACGSGNFLTETYTCIRRLENRALRQIVSDRKEITDGQMLLTMVGEWNPIKVSIDQFYGIEINDFAVSVAMTALWISESQMLEETRQIVEDVPNFLPLKEFKNIRKANALRIDWNDVISKDRLSYIMGNPPFVGYRYQTGEQKQDISFLNAFANKKIDYVACWYYKAIALIRNTCIRAAFVSTNSITQGEQNSIIWDTLFQEGLKIFFAYRSFKWGSESTKSAHVHCVIIGFSYEEIDDKRLFISNGSISVKHINSYLLDAPNVIMVARTSPISKNAPTMMKGSQPTDGGNLIFKQKEMDEFVRKEPLAKKYIRTFLGADEYINGRPRYCLWLKDASPSDLRKMPQVLKRLVAVTESRKNSPKVATQEWSDRPTLFTEDRQPDTDFIIIPEISSERRKYVPIGFTTPDVICSNKLQIIPNATLYDFGILTSIVNMSWIKAICGRLEMRLIYSNSVVYNNFPWCSPTDSQKSKIEQTAQAILDARALYPDCSLADLYDDITMPVELRKAHEANDKSVMKAYGFSQDMTESQIVAALMQMYKKLTESQ